MRDNQAHFLEAYEQHADALFRYCVFKVRDRDTAKDLLQEAFMKAWDSLSQGNEVQNMRAFLYKILGNLIIDHYRKKKSASLDELSEAGFDPAAPIESTAEDRFDGERAIALIKELPKEYRDVIFMRCIEDMSFKEIAEITGEVENTVAVRFHRGIKKARSQFDFKYEQ